MNSVTQELIEAAMKNSLPEVRRLLSLGADVNAKHFDGETPLHWTASVQVLQALRENGADIEAKDDHDMRPLHCACLGGHLAVVNELLSPNDSHDATSRGANIEAKDSVGHTPLHNASWSGHLPVVKALVSGGANILAANNYRVLPVHDAVSRRRSAVAKYLMKQLYATTRRLPLHELLEDLTWIGDPIGASVGVPPLFTALHLNVLGTDDVVEILEYLVGQNPALLSSHDQDGLLPLHVACRRGVSFAIVQSVANLYKASVKSLTPQGDLPLFLACEMPVTSLDTIFLLIKLYPDVVYR
jgi:ankyrin repeat protein